MTKKTHTTYTLQISSTSRYGSNQTYYFRTEEEARRERADLIRWFKNVPSQKIHKIQSHTWEG